MILTLYPLLSLKDLSATPLEYKIEASLLTSTLELSFFMNEESVYLIFNDTLKKLNGELFQTIDNYYFSIQNEIIMLGKDDAVL